MHYLTDRDVADLREIRRAHKLDNTQLPRIDRKNLPFRYETAYLAKTGDAIPARTGDAPGTGEVTLYDVNDEGALEAIKDSEGQDRKKDVYNPHEGPILGSSFTRIILFGNQWFIASPPTAFVAKTGGSPIAAMSGTTPGSGTVTLYAINDSGVLESLSETVTAYNIASGEVAADTFIQVKLCAGKWVIDFESCPA